jgi:tol-pal system protein YbgF
MQGEYEMKINLKNTHIFFIGWVIILIAPFFGSCATDEKFAYTNDQINATNKKIESLEETVNKTFDKKLGDINSNQAAIRLEIDQLKGDMRNLSGRVEETENLIKHSVEVDLTTLDTVRIDLANLTSKVNKLETSVTQQQNYLNIEEAQMEGAKQENPETVSVSGAAGSAQDPGMQYLYDSSLAQFNEGQYNESMSGFKSFLAQYPKSDLSDNAQFWIGECLMNLGQYEEAIVAFQEVIEKYPKGNKVSNAMLRQAIAFLEINDKKASKALLNQVIKKYPKSNEAKIAQKKLDTMK